MICHVLRRFDDDFSAIAHQKSSGIAPEQKGVPTIPLKKLRSVLDILGKRAQSFSHANVYDAERKFFLLLMILPEHNLRLDMQTKDEVKPGHNMKNRGCLKPKHPVKDKTGSINLLPLECYQCCHRLGMWIEESVALTDRELLTVARDIVLLLESAQK